MGIRFTEKILVHKEGIKPSQNNGLAGGKWLGWCDPSLFRRCSFAEAFAEKVGLPRSSEQDTASSESIGVIFGKELEELVTNRFSLRSSFQLSEARQQCRVCRGRRIGILG